MSLFSKIARVLGRQNEADESDPLQKQLEHLNKDGRLHARYVIHGEGIALLKLDDGLTGFVKDISYGGMAVRFVAEGNATLPSVLPPVVTGTFILLDRQIRCKLSPVRVVSQNSKVLFVGLSLRHESPETLIFLRDLIEPLRCGRSLAVLTREMRNEKYRGEEWSCLRGDGPTDLLLKTTPDGAGLAEALLTFRVNEQYAELSFKADKMSTGRSLEDEGGGMLALGSRMATTSEVDKAVLRHAVYILMASPAACRKVARPILKQALQTLELAFNENVAA